jgi:hypothetical protein
MPPLTQTGIETGSMFRANAPALSEPRVATKWEVGLFVGSTLLVTSWAQTLEPGGQLSTAMATAARAVTQTVIPNIEAGVEGPLVSLVALRIGIVGSKR